MVLKLVNAKKHRVLKVVNELTKPERILRQEINQTNHYNKNKFKVNSECNFHKEKFGKLENHYGKIFHKIS